MADDGHGTFNWRITAFRHAVTEDSELGLEATEALHEFGRAFGAEMNAAASKIDMTLPEALSFRKAWEDLRDEFQSFMSLVPLSNAVQLVDLAGQAQQFATKLAALPPVRRRKQPMPSGRAERMPKRVRLNLRFAVDSGYQPSRV